MKRVRTVFISLLLLSVMMFCQTAFAEEDTDYTYTIKVYAGNAKIGKLTGGGVTVASGSGASIDYNGDCVVVSGLKFGDVVYINAQDAAEVVDSRYYVRGITQAGREESERTEGTFRVEGDRDYVAAYGIKGDMVAYTVQYVDADGNELLATDTYYGNPGERQYVSSRYVDGYMPQAFNLVKTLSANEAENIFTFRYAPVAAGTVTTPPAAETGTGTETAPAPGTTPGTATDTATDTTTTPGEDDELVDVPEDETPQDLVDLDDEDVPLANVKEDRPGTVLSQLPIYIGVGILAVAALVIAAVYLKKHKKQ